MAWHCIDHNVNENRIRLEDYLLGRPHDQFIIAPMMLFGEWKKLWFALLGW